MKLDDTDYTLLANETMPEVMSELKKLFDEHLFIIGEDLPELRKTLWVVYLSGVDDGLRVIQPIAERVMQQYGQN